MSLGTGVLLYSRSEMNVCILVVEKYIERNILNEVAEHLFTPHTNGNFT